MTLEELKLAYAECSRQRNALLKKLKSQVQPTQQEPVSLKWQQAPVKTQWGDEMVVASVAIDKDHAVCLYCERNQTPKVDAMFALAAQPAQQEPVAYIRVSKTGNVMACAKTGDFYSLPDGTLLYTSPPALKENT